MADVTLKYKGDTIAELSESGSKTIETAGKYCEADILLEYVKSSGENVGITMDSGEFTITGNSQKSKTVSHELGKLPFAVFVYPKNAVNNPNNNVIGGITFSAEAAAQNAQNIPATTGQYLKIGTYTTSSSPSGASELYSGTSGNYVKNFTTSTFDLVGSSSYPIYPTTYIWKAYAFND